MEDTHVRLAGIEKGGFYPYPPHMAEACKRSDASWFSPPPAGICGRLFDPCAGEGEIASLLGKLLNCETWGCELFPYRAEKAAARMDKCHSAAWESCSLTDESVTLLWLNAPYDDDRHGEDKRLEFAFLKSTTPKLVRGGELAFVIPQRILGLPEIARYLAGHFESTTVLRFPNGEFQRFKQILLLAQRRQAYNVPSNEEVEAIQALAQADLPPLEFAPVPVYPVLPAPLKGAGGRAITFRRLDWAPDDLVEVSRWSGVRKTRAWQDLVDPKNGEVAFTPAMPLKKGHLAMLMASGLIGTLSLTDDDGHPMLVKGRVVKVVDKTTHRDDHDPDTLVERFRDRYVTMVATLSAAHSLEIIQDAERLTEFMKAHGDKIAAHTLSAYQPLYDLKPSEEKLGILDRLGRQRRPLPGQAVPGLLPTQKHAAIAAARAIRSHRTANAQGEMGSGKSTIGLAVPDLLYTLFGAWSKTLDWTRVDLSQPIGLFSLGMSALVAILTAIYLQRSSARDSQSNGRWTRQAMLLGILVLLLGPLPVGMIGKQVVGYWFSDLHREFGMRNVVAMDSGLPVQRQVRSYWYNGSSQDSLAIYYQPEGAAWEGSLERCFDKEHRVCNDSRTEGAGEKNHFVDKSNFSCILDMSHLRDDVYKNRSIFLIKAIKILFISGMPPLRGIKPPAEQRYEASNV
jgi:hypothetical protein